MIPILNIMGVAHCDSNFLCNLFFNGNFKRKWPFNASCFAPLYVRNEGPNEIWVLSTFCMATDSFFEGPRSFAPIFFQEPFNKKKYNPCSHDADMIFLLPAIILLAVAVRSSLLSLCCALTDTR